MRDIEARVCVCYTLRMNTVCAFFASKQTLSSIKSSQTITLSMAIVNDTNVDSNDSILTTELSRVVFSDCKILSFYDGPASRIFDTRARFK